MMKRLALSGAVLALLSVTLYAAGVTKIYVASSLTMTCQDGNVALKTGSSKGLYWCDAGTWTGPLGTGLGTVTTTGSPASGNLAKFSGSTSVTNTDLSGDVTTSGTLATTLAASGVSAATYGDSTHVPQITLDAKGRATAASNVAVTASGIGATSTYTSALASPPGSPSAGDLWLPTDTPYLFRYSGSAWIPWGPIAPMTDPRLPSWAWVNQGTATISTGAGALVLTAAAAGGGGPDIKARVYTAPSTPYTITAIVVFNQFVNANSNSAGLCWRDSGSGKIQTAAQLYDNARGTPLEYTVGNYDSATSFNAFRTVVSNYVTAPKMWFRITDDGANRSFSWSLDGVTFVTIDSFGRTTFITPDQVGFYVNAQSSSALTMTVLSWTQS